MSVSLFFLLLPLQGLPCQASKELPDHDVCLFCGACVGRPLHDKVSLGGNGETDGIETYTISRKCKYFVFTNEGLQTSSRKNQQEINQILDLRFTTHDVEWNPPHFNWAHWQLTRMVQGHVIVTDGSEYHKEPGPSVRQFELQPSCEDHGSTNAM